MPVDPSSDAERIVHNISDTALWAAAFRAQETERPDALFRDPFARALAGSRGLAIARALSREDEHNAWVARTYLFDQYIEATIKTCGVDTVLNLGAGLDARPYRMALPRRCRWIEIDLPEIFEYKRKILAKEAPACELEQISLDICDENARRKLFEQVDRSAGKVLVLSEGLLIYLAEGEVSSLARDLAAHETFQHWVLEIANPAAVQKMQSSAPLAHHLGAAKVVFKFGPADGPDFFTNYGWHLTDLRGILKTLVGLRRTRLDPRLIHLVPEWPWLGANSVPWVGVAIFKNMEQLQLFSRPTEVLPFEADRSSVGGH